MSCREGFFGDDMWCVIIVAIIIICVLCNGGGGCGCGDKHC